MAAGVHHGRSSRCTACSTRYTIDGYHDGGHPEFVNAASSQILTPDGQPIPDPYMQDILQHPWGINL
jgi:hypothetical protein